MNFRWATLIRDRYDDYDGFVILHGTDTMAYSASALSFMLNARRYAPELCEAVTFIVPAAAAVTVPNVPNVPKAIITASSTETNPVKRM